ncbi:hypothetical protein M404DRAFT_1006587 [Pisolithus tinctorius Marx 270]|uniref:Uncharacterized protein n=1 Tax=Pisolithus tinctorius Marx 270 TaxID=870435 RepID=A0A0C3II55_PISTI|nr:hypothetical protein M404DRAFT_1006587 [Pisolithus tinctorius Marx 270]
MYHTELHNLHGPHVVHLVRTADTNTMHCQVYNVTACEIEKRAEMDAECPLLGPSEP